LGGDVTAYSLARTFHEAFTVKSVVISLRKSGFVSYSAFIDNRVVPKMEELDTFLATMRALAGEFSGKKLIILACGDWYVRTIIENRGSFPDNIVVPYIGLELLDELVLKDKFYEKCAALGIPYPKTRYFTMDDDPAALVDSLDFAYPVIAKPASSAEYHYAEFAGKMKVFKCDTREHLIDTLTRVKASSYTYKFILQEFIPGDDTNMRILTCYCDERSDVQFASFGRVVLEEHGARAIGNPVVIINDVNAEVVEQATRLLKSVGYTGFANFDLKYDARDGVSKFFETNTRLGRSNFYVTGSGFNVSEWIINDLILHNPLTYTVADKPHVYTLETKRVIRDYVTDDALFAEIDQLWRGGAVSNPLRYKADKSFLHRLFYLKFMYNQRRNYYEQKKHDRY
jgi:D-aspartate ligase